MLVLLFGSMAGPSRADAWARGRGKAYGYLGVATTSATTAFDEKGNRVPFPGRGAEQTRASLYVEGGLSDTFTVVAAAPYERVTSRGLFNDFTTTGTGDLDIRLRASRKTSAGVFALEGGVFAPLGYDRRAFPQLGTGVVEPIVNAAYGTSVGVLPAGFLSVQIGYRVRGGGVSDELPYSVKLGTFLHPRIGTFLGVRGWKSRGDFRNVDPEFALTTQDSELLSAAAEIYLHLTPRVDVNTSWARPFAGKNGGIGREWALGLAFHSP